MVEKIVDGNGSISVKYSFKYQQSSDYMVYVVVEEPSVKFLRRFYAEDDTNNEIYSAEHVVRLLHDFVDVRWLSVNRKDYDEEFMPPRRRADLLDLKIDDLIAAVAKYAATLDNRYAELFAAFQKKTFMSLLYESATGVMQQAHLIDVASEKAALSKVFELFEIDKRSYEKKIDRQFKEVEKAKQTLSGGGPISIENFAAVYSTSKTHTVVAEYNKLLADKSALYEKFNKYINTVNEFLGKRKRVQLNEENEIVFLNGRDGKEIHHSMLSSGEKQLFILLTEAFLQLGSPVFFIADEPELSLHLGWQERIVESIGDINPQAQIFVATHSPDIVSKYGDNVIDMMDVIDYV